MRYNQIWMKTLIKTLLIVGCFPSACVRNVFVHRTWLLGYWCVRNFRSCKSKFGWPISHGFVSNMTSTRDILPTVLNSVRRGRTTFFPCFNRADGGRKFWRPGYSQFECSSRIRSFVGNIFLLKSENYYADSWKWTSIY